SARLAVALDLELLVGIEHSITRLAGQLVHPLPIERGQRERQDAPGDARRQLPLSGSMTRLRMLASSFFSAANPWQQATGPGSWRPGSSDISRYRVDDVPASRHRGRGRGLRGSETGWKRAPPAAVIACRHAAGSPRDRQAAAPPGWRARPE